MKTCAGAHINCARKEWLTLNLVKTCARRDILKNIVTEEQSTGTNHWNTLVFEYTGRYLR